MKIHKHIIVNNIHNNNDIKGYKNYTNSSIDENTNFQNKIIFSHYSIINKIQILIRLIHITNQANKQLNLSITN